jgi:hypothetical protein
MAYVELVDRPIVEEDYDEDFEDLVEETEAEAEEPARS